MKRRVIGLFLMGLLLTATLSGCHNADNKVQNQTEVESTILSKEVHIDKKNRIDYQTGMECSGFSSAYILRHFGEEADGIKVYQDIPNKMSDGGVAPTSIVSFFTERGYQVEFKTDGTIDDLRKELSAGYPVIVFIHMKEPYTSVHETHYVPMTGYDSDYVYIAESVKEAANCLGQEEKGYNRKIDIDKFERLWSNIDGIWDHPYFVIHKE